VECEVASEKGRAMEVFEGKELRHHPRAIRNHVASRESMSDLYVQKLMTGTKLVE
jgi:hypothetical protein